MNPIYPDDAASMLDRDDVIFLDVRTKAEFQARRIQRAVNIPLDELLQRYSELERDKSVIVLCEHGIRSQHAAGLLSQIGFEFVMNMVGGMSQWRHETVTT